MKKRSILNTPRLQEMKKEKNKVIRNRIIFFSVLFIVFLVGLIFLSSWRKINIEKINIEGNKIVETKKIEESINKIMNGKYLWVFPKRNSFIYPTKQIKKALNNEFKRLKDISINIEVNDLQVLNVFVSEYEGKYLWCGKNVTEDFSNQQCYFLDSNGYIFDEAPYFSGEVYFKLYGNLDSNSQYPIGSYFVPSYFNNIISFKEAIEKMNLKPAVFYLEDNEDGSIYLSGEKKAPNSLKIIFKLDSDYDKLIENLQSAITNEPLQTDLKTKLSLMSYIDLRFGNKIYFK